MCVPVHIHEHFFACFKVVFELDKTQLQLALLKYQK